MLQRLATATELYMQVPRCVLLPALLKYISSISLTPQELVHFPPLPTVEGVHLLKPHKADVVGGGVDDRPLVRPDPVCVLVQAGGPSILA